MDVAMSTAAGVAEMRTYARAEDRRRKMSLASVDFEDATEVGDRVG